jgi:hypothetical protein
VNPATGSVLIGYSEDELTEAQLLGFLQAITGLVLRHWNQFRAVPQERRPEVLKRLAHEVGLATGPRLALKKDLEIPAHVWS